MKYIQLIIFVLTLSPWTQSSVFATDEVKKIIADFNQAQLTNKIGADIEVWLKDNGSDPTQSCKMSFASDDALGLETGHSLRLDYDVESTNPAYNGIRMGLLNLDASQYKSLHFYIKGDREEGFSQQIKIELADKSKSPSPRVIQNVTDQWQKVSLELADFWGIQDWTSLHQFVVVFADITNDPQVGTIYIDHIYFS